MCYPFATLTATNPDMSNNKKSPYMKIPGLSFSLKRALGISAAKQKISRATGIPTTRGGLERKVGRMVLNAVFGKKKKR